MDITLGGYEVTLVRPSHMATLALSDMLTERQDFHGRAAVAAAALRICWPEDKKWPGNRRPMDWGIRTHLLDYGAECYETLALLEDSNGGAEALYGAMFSALTFALESRLSEEAVAAAAGFSEAPEGG